MSLPHQPIPGVRRFPERPLFDDEPEQFWCPCGELLDELHPIVCAKCVDRAHQRDVEPCVLCGRDTTSTTSVCARCSDQPTFREWSEQR